MKVFVAFVCAMCCDGYVPTIEDLPSYETCWIQMNAAEKWQVQMEWQVAISPSRELILQEELQQARRHYTFWATATSLRTGRCDAEFVSDGLLEMQAQLGRDRWFCRDWPWIVTPSNR